MGEKKLLFWLLILVGISTIGVLVTNNESQEEIVEINSEEEFNLLKNMIQKGTFDFCDSLNNEDYKLICFVEKNMVEGNYKSCNKLSNLNNKDLCLYYSASIYDTSSCELISEDSLKENCPKRALLDSYLSEESSSGLLDNFYFFISIDREIEGFCDEINDEFLRDFCYEISAEKYLDPAYCAPLNNLENQMDCYINIATTNEDKEICYEISPKGFSTSSYQSYPPNSAREKCLRNFEDSSKEEFILATTLNVGSSGSSKSGVYSDGEYIYASSSDKFVYVWDKENFKILGYSEKGSSQIKSVFSDGEYIYGSDTQGDISIWDKENFNLVTLLSEVSSSEDSIIMGEVYVDEDYIYGSNENGRVYIWDKNNFDLITSIMGPTSDYLSGIIVDDSNIYASSGDNKIYIWDKNNFDLITTLVGGAGYMRDVYVDEDYIYGSNWDKKIYIWDKNNFDLITSILTPGIPISVTSDEHYIYNANWDGNVYIWDKNNFKNIQNLTEGSDHALGIYVDEDFLYMANRDSNIYIWTKPSTN